MLLNYLPLRNVGFHSSHPIQPTQKIKNIYLFDKENRREEKRRKNWA